MTSTPLELWINFALDVEFVVRYDFNLSCLNELHHYRMLFEIKILIVDYLVYR
jgi:hypothetical protein